ILRGGYLGQNMYVRYYHAPRSSIGTSFEVIDLSTGATTGPNAATVAPEK
ncbi:hypothetical protein ALC60_04986, partial [Trachymyrmex zeteki]